MASSLMRLLKVHSFVFLILLGGQLILPTGAQTSHTVIVGLEGSFFNPPTISAGQGDTITFVFAGQIHTVTQSTFEEPCTPLPGGFNSGLAGRARNSSTTPQTWDLHVTNVSTPIWFYCLANRPSFHCSAGMVGVINPPSQEMYSRFLNAAKAVSASPSAPFTPILTGIGAYATAAPAVPTPPPTASTASSSSNDNTTEPLSSGSSALASDTAAPASASPSTSTTPTEAARGNLVIVVGGAVGGGLAALLMVITMFFCFRQQKLSQKRYLAELNSRIDKERELEARPFSLDARDGQGSIRSLRTTTNYPTTDNLTAPTRLQPLRRRATVVGSTSSLGSILRHTSATSSDQATLHTVPSDDTPLPPMPTTAKTAASSHSRPSTHPRESDMSSFVFPNGDNGAIVTDAHGRQRFLFVNNPASSRPSSNQVTPEQYWSTQIRSSGQHLPQGQYGYSTSPPNYLAATGGKGHEP